MKKYGLIGFPLKHSFSKNFFNEKFEKEKIEAEYVNFEIPEIKFFPKVIADNKDLLGLNVTIPYKEQILPFLDDISPDALNIGAVNVIRIKRKDEKVLLKGYNSDVIGFTRSIEPLLKTHHKQALILGTGGASKAVKQGLKSLNIEYTYVSRHKNPGMLTYEQISPELIQEYTVIINCTPCGMFPHSEECPQLPYEALNHHHLLYDLIYNPDKTLFLKKGFLQGAETKNGLEMLLLQAVAGWEFWNEED